MSEQDINQAEQAKDQVDAEIKEDENLLEVKASMGDPSEVPDPIATKAKKNKGDKSGGTTAHDPEVGLKMKNLKKLNHLYPKLKLE